MYDLNEIREMGNKNMVRLLANVIRLLDEDDKRTQDATETLKLISIVWGERCEKFMQDEAKAIKADGMLSAFNYHVGNEGRRKEYRRRVLRYIVNYNLPPVLNAHYMNEWGEPCTEKRIKKLKRTLGGLSFSNQRRGREFQRARIEWTNDLTFLEENLDLILESKGLSYIND
tara:strand:- start:77 stop:592 length:516 start_codon:yes stop_codon:yes gene_type:complete